MLNCLNCMPCLLVVLNWGPGLYYLTMSYICSVHCSVYALSLDTAQYLFTADIHKSPGSSTCVQCSVITDVVVIRASASRLHGVITMWIVAAVHVRCQQCSRVLEFCGCLCLPVFSPCSVNLFLVYGPSTYYLMPLFECFRQKWMAT